MKILTQTESTHRRMFPPVRINFSIKETENGESSRQEQSRERYHVLMDILPYDNKRYRYAYHKSSWLQAGKAEEPAAAKLFLHPEGPFTVEQLKHQVFSFEKIKLTNNKANKPEFVSMITPTRI